MRFFNWILLLVALCGAVAPVAAQRTKYGVTVDVSEEAALAKASTYSYVPGQPTIDKNLDLQIVAAIEKELQSRGLTKATGTPDLVVSYFSVRRTDVDLKSKPSADGNLPQYPVGTLLLSIVEPARKEKLFNARLVQPLDLDAPKPEVQVLGAVADIFEKYPVKPKR